MTRQLKFRVWDKEEKVMIDADSFYIEFGEMEPLKDAFQGLEYQYEIMQFTGLQDIDNEEMYEEDIIHDGKENYLVMFINGCFVAMPIFTFNDDSDNGSHGELLCRIISPKIIGNRFEHPHLLEKK